MENTVGLVLPVSSTQDDVEGDNIVDQSASETPGGNCEELQHSDNKQICRQAWYWSCTFLSFSEILKDTVQLKQISTKALFETFSEFLYYSCCLCQLRMIKRHGILCTAYFMLLIHGLSYVYMVVHCVWVMLFLCRKKWNSVFIENDNHVNMLKHVRHTTVTVSVFSGNSNCTYLILQREACLFC